ncbi:MAG: LysR family transcriptional regulator [Gammaproteobacteria bacterium]|jgi:LysR family hydrogen peroxide-inducible transcriptional activator|nr:LysR family transcriptional regulator [Gammaproteobacteria bacterium]
MNLRALNYFVKLADLRHFSKAAEACFVSQPTLSTQIKKLEEELGVQLVERSPKNIMLTPVGEDIADRARLVLGEIEQIRTVARRSGNPAEGALRLGLFPTLAPYYLPHIVPILRQQYPNMKLQLAEEKTGDILRQLHHGGLDAALLALPVEEDGLEVEILFEEPFVLALPGNHPLVESQRITLTDLNGNELLLLEEGHCLRDHALEVCALAGAHERVDFHATSMETLRQMVAANVGITLMPMLSVKPPIAATENIVIRQFEQPAPSRTIALVWRSSSALSPFLRDLAGCIGSLPADLLKIQERATTPI